MKKIITFLIIVGLLVFIACTPKFPDAPQLNIPQDQLVLSKMVYLGNSLTAGFQSAGLVQDFQMHSYPYLIAQQLGKASIFEQPLIADPGIGSTPGKTPLYLDPVSGTPVADDLTVDPATLLLNATLSRPYDNLGVPGADLNDVLNTVDGSGGNAFFDLVLRNPNFAGMTQLEQVIALLPTLVTVWVGNNDVLGAALAGGDLTQITPAADFQANYAAMLTELGGIREGNVGIILLNIPNVTDIPYVNVLDDILQPIPALGINYPVPVLFQTEANALGGVDFVPIDFGGFYLPLYTAEIADTVQHVLLPALSEYQSTGLGVPNAAIITATLIQAGWDSTFAAGTAQQLEAGMVAAGLTPSGVPVPGNLTITKDERDAIGSAVTGFNQIISAIAGNASIPVVNANSLLSDLNATGIDGYSGKFVLSDPVNTAFSLDGVHPNNGGNAIVANAVISLMNSFSDDIQIPLINTAQYKGQYIGKPVETISKEAANLVKPLFVKNKN